MNNFLRTLIAGYGAKKLGGGCLSTIIVFIIIYWALGNCNSRPVQTRHADIHLQNNHSVSMNYLKSKQNETTVAFLYNKNSMH